MTDSTDERQVCREMHNSDEQRGQPLAYWLTDALLWGNRNTDILFLPDHNIVIITWSYGHIVFRCDYWFVLTLRSDNRSQALESCYLIGACVWSLYCHWEWLENSIVMTSLYIRWRDVNLMSLFFFCRSLDAVPTLRCVLESVAGPSTLQ